MVNLLCLLRMVVDAIVAGEVEQPLVAGCRSLTVWTGVDWFAVTVMPVAFGRWGVAVCRDEAPRRAEPIELVSRARSEPEARGRALLLVEDALNGGPARDVGILPRAA